MAPIKFEEHIKEKLDQREITPSAGSWDKLNKSLKEAEGGKKRLNWWIPSVAAVVVVMICGFLFSDLYRNQEAQVVETSIEKPSEEKVPVIHKVQQEIASETKDDMDTNNQKSSKRKNLGSNKAAASASNVQSAVVSSEIKEDLKSAEEMNATPIATETGIAQNEETIRVSEEIEGILEKVSKLKESNGEVTNAEVDALLAQAASKISSRRNMAKSETISADALLADVEDEVYESFKEKVFEMVKTGYQKAAVAVSNKLDHSQEK